MSEPEKCSYKLTIYLELWKCKIQYNILVEIDPKSMVYYWLLLIFFHMKNFLFFSKYFFRITKKISTNFRVWKKLID